MDLGVRIGGIEASFGSKIQAFLLKSFTSPPL